MKRTQIALLALAGCMFLFVPNTARATTGWMIAWLNAYPDRCQDLKDAAQSCTLCHGAGSSLNNYSKQMANLNFVGRAESPVKSSDFDWSRTTQARRFVSSWKRRTT